MQVFDNILAIFRILLLIWGGVSLCGLIIYKGGYADSWEQGLNKAATGWWKVFLDFLFESNTPETIINVSLLLSPAEQKELLRRFENHPFDAPAFTMPPDRIADCLWIDIKANGLIEKYKSLKLSQLQELVTNIIQNFYFEIREIVAVPIYVKILAPDRLYFAIPLNSIAQNMLEKQKASPTPAVNKRIPSLIVEDIDINLHDKEQR